VGRDVACCPVVLLAAPTIRSLSMVLTREGSTD
jgi:hypothetical protein